MSCGCFRNEQSSNANTKHGLTKTNKTSELALIWYGMKRRCFDVRHPSYKNYGGRGITMSDEFLDIAKFCAYVKETIGERPTKKHSIDRIDNSKGYCPGNIRWSLPPDQSRNKRTNRIVVVNGNNMPLVDAAEYYGIKYNCVKSRLALGWSVEDALTRPVRKHAVNNAPERVTARC